MNDADRNILRILPEVRRLSHDPDRAVGVIITKSSGEILSTGTNSPPITFGYSTEETHAAIKRDPQWKYYLLEHAERNAIFHARDRNVSLRGTTMYGTLFPCADCARAIVAAGISRVVVPEPGLHPVRDEKWSEHYRYAREVFDLADIIVDHYPADLLEG